MSSAPRLDVALVCDDRPVVRHVLVRMLQRHGYTVAEASDLPELEAAGRAQEPRLAVLALPIQGAPGVRAVQALREAAPGCAVVVLSPLSGLADEALDAGALALLEEHDLPGLACLLPGLSGAEVLTSPGRPPVPPGRLG